jgi:ribosomal protein L16 Arg81 hydroxylase
MPELTLGGLLAPLSRDEFLGNYFGQKLLHIPGGDPRKYDRLFSWTALNDLLRHVPFEPDRLRLVKNRQSVSPDRLFLRSRSRLSHHPRFATTEVIAQLREGATLVLNTVDALHEPLTALAQALEFELRTPVWTNLYASWREIPGFDLHWDRHDVFILQIAGRKSWRIYGPTRRFPLDNDIEAPAQPEDPPLVEQMMQKGDFLYLPRGWWHAVTACGEPTLHLTIGIENPTGMDLAGWVIERLRQYEQMRVDIPRFADAASTLAYLDSLRSLVFSGFSDDRLISEYLDYLDEQAAPRVAIGLPHSTDPYSFTESDVVMIRLLNPRPLVMPSSYDFVFNGKAATIHPATQPLFEYVLRNCPMSTKHFYSMFSEEFESEVLTTFLSDLTSLGLISIAKDGTAQRQATAPQLASL